MASAISSDTILGRSSSLLLQYGIQLKQITDIIIVEITRRKITDMILWMADRGFGRGILILLDFFDYVAGASFYFRVYLADIFTNYPYGQKL